MNSCELKVDVPLATGEDSDVEDEIDDNKTPKKVRVKTSDERSRSVSRPRGRGISPKFNLDEGDSVAGSLEDLVNSFDDKLTKVLHDYQEKVEKIAPVQVRSQEEIMNECQVWWTITGNFGNMMPIDWSKSTARAKHLNSLDLKDGKAKVDENEEEDDDIIAADLDMHTLILNSNTHESQEPMKSADEVIQEIDDMIENDGDSPKPPSVSAFSGPYRSSRVVSEALAGRKLDDLSVNELGQILSDVETLVKELSEELIADLSVRDELEYEKELKNTFISLLLSIQSKRRQIQMGNDPSVRSGRSSRRDGSSLASQYKYLTTVIPYQPDLGTPPLSSLTVLVKILKAINEDSPAVPALLTDYILKVLCPS